MVHFNGIVMIYGIRKYLVLLLSGKTFAKEIN